MNQINLVKDKNQSESEINLILLKLIKSYPDFPSKGILFHDIFPIFQDPKAVSSLISHFITIIKSNIDQNIKIDCIVGLDARGFLIGPLLAQRLDCSFIPVRKPFKLPGNVHTVSYEKEYGVDSFEIQKEAIISGSNVIVVDDLLATGGSAFAAQQLINLSKGNVLMFLFIVEIESLGGKNRLDAKSYSVLSFD